MKASHERKADIVLYISREAPEQTHDRLLRVMAAARLHVFEELYTFEELPVEAPAPVLDNRTLAAVRDDQVWSFLVPASLESSGEKFNLVRFHFAEGLDNSGFVGWLATHLKRELGTGVFVVCGRNTAQGGIFDYTGFPAGLKEAVLREISELRRAGAALTASRLQ